MDSIMITGASTSTNPIVRFQQFTAIFLAELSRKDARQLRLAAGYNDWYDDLRNGRMLLSAKSSPKGLYHMSEDFSLLCQKIASGLENHTPRRISNPQLGRAAVLIPLFQNTEGPVFLLTERTHEVETHKGQVSFPGGVMEPEDPSLRDTALREAWEEVGLATEHVTILGEFDEYQSITGLIVTPIVARIEMPTSLFPNPREVAEILTIPFSDFTEEHLTRTEMRLRGNQVETVYFYDCHGKVVWGLTARIIRDFLKWLGGVYEKGGNSG
jgi:8-oxo-dGTP pyrophosphatase MutT (NUDIX family)